MSKQKGFSLIELLIVVAIILIIAAIAIPNLLRSRMAANEASAVGSVRTINTAEVTYSVSFSDIGFTTVLSNLAGSASGCATPTGATSTNACLIDSVLGSGTKSGYRFVLAGSGGATKPNYIYADTSDPISPGTSGQRHFFSDQTGVIRVNQSAAATTASSPLQ